MKIINQLFFLLRLKIQFKLKQAENAFFICLAINNLHTWGDEN
jgi:hypothetical protein